MKISEIYEKFNISPNLREHMFRVARLCLYIDDHWTGRALNNDLIVRGALLHDLGNIVKFNLGKYPKLFDKDLARIEYWKDVQKKTIKKYGLNDHEATRKMLEEINISQKLKGIISTKSFGNSLETEKSKDWELKILYYADLRYGPFGILPLKERLDEALPRLEKYKNLGNLDNFIKACEDIEKQIQVNLDIKVSEITEKRIAKYNQNFLILKI